MHVFSHRKPPIVGVVRGEVEIKGLGRRSFMTGRRDIDFPTRTATSSQPHPSNEILKSNQQNTIARQLRGKHLRTAKWQKKPPKMQSPKKKSLAPRPQPRQPCLLVTHVSTPPSPLPHPYSKLPSALLISTQLRPSCPQNEKPLLRLQHLRRSPSRKWLQTPSRGVMD